MGKTIGGKYNHFMKERRHSNIKFVAKDLPKRVNLEDCSLFFTFFTYFLNKSALATKIKLYFFNKLSIDFKL